MNEPLPKTVEVIPDNKIHVVSLKIQPDLYRWLVHEAHQRRTTVSYVIRELVNSAKLAQEGNSDG
jgi:hypothetical protein